MHIIYQRGMKELEGNCAPVAVDLLPRERIERQGPIPSAHGQRGVVLGQNGPGDGPNGHLQGVCRSKRNGGLEG